MKVFIIYNDDFDQYDNIEKCEIERVCDALMMLGHTIECCPIDKIGDLSSVLHGDLVFNLFEGSANNPESEVLIAERLEKMSMPFTGNSSSTLKYTLDKIDMKTLLRDCGIRTPNHIKITLYTNDVNIKGLRFPLIIKPRSNDASNGIDFDNVVYQMSTLMDKIESMLSRYHEVIVEDYIDGREFNVGLLGKKNEMKVTAISEIVYDFPVTVPKILTFDSKWKKDSLYFNDSSPVCPADVNDDMKFDLYNLAIKSCGATGCEGYARVDLRQDEKNNNYVLEVNANPDLSDDAGFVLQATQSGLSYVNLIDEIVKCAMSR